MCSKPDRGGCQVLKCSCISEFGQRSTECKIIEQTPISLSSTDHIISIKFPDTIQDVLNAHVLLDFSLSVKAATLIFIYGCGSAILSAKKGKSGFIYNLVKSK